MSEHAANVRPKTREFFLLLAGNGDLLTPDRRQYRTVAALEAQANIVSFTGLTYWEITALRIADIDFNDRSIRVRFIMTRAGHLHPQHDALLRDVMLPDHVGTMLEEWLRRHRVGAQPQELLFPPSAPPSSQDRRSRRSVS